MPGAFYILFVSFDAKIFSYNYVYSLGKVQMLHKKNLFYQRDNIDLLNRHLFGKYTRDEGHIKHVASDQINNQNESYSFLLLHGNSL